MSHTSQQLEAAAMQQYAEKYSPDKAYVAQSLGIIALGVEASPEWQVEWERYETWRANQDPQVLEDRAELLNNFDHFAPVIGRIQSQASQLGHQNISQHTNFLGKGHFSAAFSFGFEGRTYVARMPNDDDPNVRSYRASQYVTNLLPGYGVPHLEQPVAYSLEKGMVIASYIPGQPVEQLGPGQMHDISSKHLESLLDTFEAMSVRGLMLDANKGNLLYDPKEGFGIIDYQSGQQHSNVQDMLRVFVGALNKHPNANLHTPQDYKTAALHIAANLEPLRSLQRVCTKRYKKHNREIVEYVNKIVNEAEQKSHNYADEAWIRNQLSYQARTMAPERVMT